MQIVKKHAKLVGILAVAILAIGAAVGTVLAIYLTNVDPIEKLVSKDGKGSYIDELLKDSMSGASDKVLLFDFESYDGENQTPGGFITKDVEMGETYTFSFEYCLVGETLGVTCVNAANEWGMGSEVKFGTEPLQGKGKLSFTFQADYPAILPTFQSYIPAGAAKLYVWIVSGMCMEQF